MERVGILDGLFPANARRVFDRPPAFLTCPDCGAYFRSPLQVAAPVYEMLVSNVTAGCPQCGATVRVPDGTYTSKEFLQKFIDARPSLDELAALSAALQSPAAIQSTEAARAAIESAVPRLAPLVFDDVWKLPPGTLLRFLRVLFNFIPILIGILKGPVVGAVAAAAVAWPKEQLDKAIAKAEALTDKEAEIRKRKNKRKTQRRARAKRG